MASSLCGPESREIVEHVQGKGDRTGIAGAPSRSDASGAPPHLPDWLFLRPSRHPAASSAALRPPPAARAWAGRDCQGANAHGSAPRPVMGGVEMPHLPTLWAGNSEAQATLSPRRALQYLVPCVGPTFFAGSFLSSRTCADGNHLPSKLLALTSSLRVCLLGHPSRDRLSRRPLLVRTPIGSGPQTRIPSYRKSRCGFNFSVPFTGGAGSFRLCCLDVSIVCTYKENTALNTPSQSPQILSSRFSRLCKIPRAGVRDKRTWFLCF